MGKSPKGKNPLTRSSRTGRFYLNISKGLPSMRITGAGVVEVSAKDLLNTEKVREDFESATRIVAHKN